MSKRRPTQDEIQAALNEGHFGSTVRELRPSDPIERMPMRVTLDKLREYDHNPRRERNPKYAEIKEAIRAKGGLDGPLTITRRPDEHDKPYMVYAGGNSRLRILNELYAETQNPEFFEVDCLFVPWRSEAETIIAHLVENDVRGDLMFIDRALAIRDLRGEVERERGETLSQRQFAGLLRERGYRIDHTQVIRMEYAVETLLPAIPLALRAGMGMPQIKRIRQFENAVHKYLEHCDIPTHTAEARAIFLEILSRYDSQEWDLVLTQRDMEERLAQLTRMPVMTVRMDLEAILSGHSPGSKAPETTRPAAPNRDGLSPETADIGSQVNTKANEDSSFQSQGDSNTNPVQERPDDEDPKAKAPKISILDYRTSSEGGEEKPLNGVDTTEAPCPKDLRARMWTVATQLAQRHGLGDCVLTVNGGGGYMIDMPPQPLQAQPDVVADPELKRITVWWFLASLVDQWAVFEDADAVAGVVDLMPPDSRIYPLLCTYRDGDLEAIERTTAQFRIYVSDGDRINVHMVCRHLMAVLDDTEFKWMITLIETRRQLQKLCQMQNKRFLWEL